MTSKTASFRIGRVRAYLRGNVWYLAYQEQNQRRQPRVGPDRYVARQMVYNLGNFLWRLTLPKPVRHWSLTTLWEKLIKIGAKVTRHSKCVLFQLVEVAVTRNLFAAILDRIARLAIPPPLLT